jgi:hypothetical protein
MFSLCLCSFYRCVSRVIYGFFGLLVLEALIFVGATCGKGFRYVYIDT